MDEIIDKIIHIPINFLQENKSPIVLFRESGYLENYMSISKNDIFIRLQANPSVIDSWLIWSDDKRTSPVWMFYKKNGRYCVGFYPKGIIPDKFFDDKAEACACYIKHEMEFIRLRSASK